MSTKLVWSVENDRISPMEATQPEIPGTSPLLIRRPKLERSIIEGIKKRLLLMVAPPGYGKTTSLVQVFSSLTRISHQPSTTTADMVPPASLRSVGRPRRIAEDTPSAGLGRKPCRPCPLSHFATKAGEKSGLSAPVVWHEVKPGELGVRAAVESFLSGMKKLSDQKQPPPPAITASTLDYALFLTHMLERFFPDGIHMVLDSLDRSASQEELTALVQGLIDHGPARLHLVVASTSRPSLKLSRFARLSELSRIGKHDLVFSPEEVKALLGLHWGREASQRLAPEVYRLSEGRPAGVALTVIAWRSPPRIGDSLLPEMTPCPGGVGSRETLESLCIEDRELLSLMSLLPEFDPQLISKLCAPACSENEVNSFLNRIAVATRSADGSYALAPGIAEQLRAEVEDRWPANKLRSVLCKAAEEFARRQKVELALDLYFSIGDTARANRLLDKIGVWEVLHKDTEVLLAWGRKLQGAPQLGATAHLLCAKAYRLSGNHPEAARHYRCTLQKGGSELGTRERLRILPGLATALGMMGDPAAAEVEREMLSIRSDSTDMEGFCHLLKGISFGRHGRLREAEKELRQAVAALRVADGGECLSTGLNSLATLQMHQGNYKEAIATSKGALHGETRLNMIDRIRSLHSLGQVWSFQGEFDLAIASAKKGLQLAQQADIKVDRFGRSLDLFDFYVWSGRIHEACHQLDQAELLAPQFRRNQEADLQLTHARARLAWRRGAEGEAIAGFQSLLSLLHRSPPYAEGWLRLEAAFVFLRSKVSQDVRGFVQSVLSQAESMEFRHLVANALLVLASLEAEEGNDVAAFENKKRGSRLAREGGFRFMPVSDPMMVEWIGEGVISCPIRIERHQIECVFQPGSEPLGKRHILELRTFGRFKIVKNGRSLDGDLWHCRGKSKLLLELLLSQDSLACSVDEIVEYLWPDADMKKGRSGVHTAVWALRKILRETGLYEAVSLKFGQGFYQLVLKNEVLIDHVKYRSLAAQAQAQIRQGNGKDADTLLREMVDLYKGDFLEDALYERFSDHFRATLFELQSFCLRNLAGLNNGPGSETVTWWRKAIEHDPYDEEAYKGYLESCIERGLVKETREGIDRLQKHLVGDLGLPMPEWAHHLKTGVT